MWSITSSTRWAQVRRLRSGTATRRHLRHAAVSAGVKRIVYLGGIVSGDGGGLSPHLRSRAEVGDILLGGDVPVVALQAAVIIGSGSASFKMLRYLTERLPVIVTRNGWQPAFSQSPPMMCCLSRRLRGAAS